MNLINKLKQIWIETSTGLVIANLLCMFLMMLILGCMVFTAVAFNG